MQIKKYVQQNDFQGSRSVDAKWGNSILTEEHDDEKNAGKKIC